ncbi:MAG: biotin--[acetyl-CoA-carboxylase] ligase [Candidatus Thermoplasmatota archaeon]|nr:biotin--[acetyl-CoA-carboxylase] ligase [Candidatus Thermoplasmatota archaeon]
MRKIFLDSAESTNDVARAFGEKGERDAVVVAREQRKGRGRNGRSWFSDAGGLYSSFILEKKRLLPFIAAISAAKTVERYVDEAGLREMDVEIKWPNDIMVRGRKVCGILCEGCRDFDIAGIGINVNNKVSLECATSIKEVTGKEPAIDEVLDSLVSNIEKNLLSPEEEVIKEYKKRCRMLGKRVKVKLEEGSIEGIAGMDEEGYLLVNGLRISVAEAIRVEQ